MHTSFILCLEYQTGPDTSSWVSYLYVNISMTMKRVLMAMPVKKARSIVAWWEIPWEEDIICNRVMHLDRESGIFKIMVDHICTFWHIGILASIANKCQFALDVDKVDCSSCFPDPGSVTNYTHYVLCGTPPIFWYQCPTYLLHILISIVPYFVPQFSPVIILLWDCQ